MIRIAICDDVESERREVADCVNSYFGKGWQAYEADEFSSGAELLKSDVKYDLYLLDVLMPETDGMRTAKELRRRYPDAIFVFITSDLDSAVEGYRVEASGFLIKPLRPDAFNETMDYLMQRGLIGPEPTLSVVSKRLPMEIPLSKIIALESELHRVYLHMDGTAITVNQRLTDIEEALAGQSEFLRCHQSFIINLRYVSDMDGSHFILSDNVKCAHKSIPISRARLKLCKMEFYQYRLNRLS
ncbi:MAG: response regulator transcription factor [Mogibacterium sp.]|nr:response regulator transcription factor [Mogibacterium sp.]